MNYPKFLFTAHIVSVRIVARPERLLWQTVRKLDLDDAVDIMRPDRSDTTDSARFCSMISDPVDRRVAVSKVSDRYRIVSTERPYLLIDRSQVLARTTDGEDHVMLETFDPSEADEYMTKLADTITAFPRIPVNRL